MLARASAVELERTKVGLALDRTEPDFDQVDRLATGLEKRVTELEDLLEYKSAGKQHGVSPAAVSKQTLELVDQGRDIQKLSKLPPEVRAAELRYVDAAQGREISLRIWDKDYDTEVELPNGHTYRRDKNTDSWCRFSDPQPTNCGIKIGDGAGGDNADIYRGTNFSLEQQILEESGYVMSDAARPVYMAQRDAGRRRRSYGIESGTYREHRVLGITRVLHPSPRCLWNRSRQSRIATWSLDDLLHNDRTVTSNFGRSVIEASVPADQLVHRTLTGANESEVLIFHMLKISKSELIKL